MRSLITSILVCVLVLFLGMLVVEKKINSKTTHYELILSIQGLTWEMRKIGRRVAMCNAVPPGIKCPFF